MYSYIFMSSNVTISYGNPATMHIHATGCRNTDQEVVYLEHLQLRTTIEYSVRGTLEIKITSPSGMFLLIYHYIIIY